MPQTTPNDTLRLGLIMAGAISAGNYTAGVLDYLYQVLDKWEEQRNQPAVPTHKIVIDVITGTSAGGMASCMATMAMHMHRPPIFPSKRSDEEYKKANIFYNSWVNMLADDMLPNLLSTSDVLPGDKLVSALNSDFITKIANRAVDYTLCHASHRPRYMRKDMQLVYSISNINGFEYKLKFSGETKSYHRMTQYRDYAFFKLSDVYDSDGRIPLNPIRDIGMAELREATPATGAFPIGLAYRWFHRQQRYICDNPYLVYAKDGVTIVPEHIKNLQPEDLVTTYHIDGGMLNNEPFDMAMKLMARQKQADVDGVDIKIMDKMDVPELEKSQKAFDATFIMIDPFPGGDKETDDDPHPTSEFPFTLTEMVGNIFGAMTGQLLFKGEDIAAMFSNEDFSRFLIAPLRKNPEVSGNLEGRNAIACGSLFGFGGFLDKSFRDHDFYLGRVNCQNFLRKYFRVQLDLNGVPVNPIFAAGYLDITTLERFKFQDSEEVAKLGTDDAPWYVPIIPDLYKDDLAYIATNGAEEPMPKYPEYNMQQFKSHKQAIKKRFTYILKQALGGVGGLVDGLLYNKVTNIVEDNLKRWKLLG